jgi:hypothetical protein
MKAISRRLQRLEKSSALAAEYRETEGASPASRLRARRLARGVPPDGLEHSDQFKGVRSLTEILNFDQMQRRRTTRIQKDGS